jgi:hypothetical protein
MRMKKIIFALFVITALFSCRPQPRELLSKKWKPVDITGVDAVRKQKVLDSSSMQFFADGRFVSVTPEVKDSGVYNLSNDGKKLRLYTLNMVQTLFIINELKWNRLVLEYNGKTMVLKPVE